MSTDPHSTADVSISTSPPKTPGNDSAAKSSVVPAVDANPSPDLSSKIEDAGEEVEGESKDGEEEEEGECGFCLFMKGGSCKETFVAWEECIAAAENGKEDLAEKCFEATSLLRKCMEANADYYEPVLRAEKAAEEVATIEVEREMAEIDEKVQKAGVLDSDGASSSGMPDAA